ncbi:superoxide dismutase [Sedimentibacter sp. zth1]|uniref:superoxide dismutase n=1 Tax=Sedimentibacter sp. zth1 TaxID=2816908 RepID=UPI001A93764D|nr:Fe-Mn family superoxide dismutase [Sedimentibacter sp. zth1]QSX07026.1 superoxide dismutase [Sedimentibacter sp. zth1]
MNKIETKFFDFSSVKDITYSQLSQHYTLYTNYVNTMPKIYDAMKNENLYNNCNSNFSEVRNIQNSLSFNLDGVKLHELYFGNLTGLNTKPNGKILELINSYFKSYDNFKKQFKCIGMSMRGWVVLCYDAFTNSIYIYGQDSHNTQIMMNTFPLIVLDVYEHAYMIDFGIKKNRYIDVFFNNLDFNVINNRLNLLFE